MSEDGRRGSVYTVGHSTRTADELIGLLREAGVTAVADVRRWPTSARLPQFCRPALEAALAAASIAYHHLGDALGGYRTGGYPAYMKTAGFERGLDALERLAAGGAVAVL